MQGERFLQGGEALSDASETVIDTSLIERLSALLMTNSRLAN